MDNGPEMIAEALRDSCRLAGTRTTYIKPGRPWESPLVEFFDIGSRNNNLYVEELATPHEAQILTEAWPNRVQHHLLLAHRTPGPGAIPLPSAAPPGARARGRRRSGASSPVASPFDCVLRSAYEGALYGWSRRSVPRSVRLDAGDVGGEEVDAVPIMVASGAVVVLGGSRVGMSSEDLGVAKRDASVQGVGDCGMTQRVRADVTGNARRFRDSQHHPVDVAAVDGSA